MPAEKQFKFGITYEFKSLWDEFESLAPGNKKSKMIRYLIYNFLYNNGNKTRNTFEDANSEDWEYVEDALKIYNKFVKERTEVMKEHVINKRKFWVERYDYAIRDEVISQEELEKLKDDGFSVMRNSIPYYLLPEVDQANDRIVLKKMKGNKHKQITRYLSQPKKYYVKCKKKIQTFDYCEKAYEEFKDEKRRWTAYKLKVKENERPPDMHEQPTVEFLYKLNWKLLKELEKNHLLDWGRQKIFSEIDGNILKKYGKMYWQKIPKEIDDCLMLNSFYLESKKNLVKIKRDALRIYKHYTILEFVEDQSPKIRGPREFVIQDADYEKASEIYED